MQISPASPSATSAPVSSRMAISVDGTGCDAHTEDLGPRGCRIVAPTRLAEGSRVGLHLACDGVPGSLSVEAEVVWGEREPPWRHGVVYASADLPRAEAWLTVSLSAAFTALPSCQSSRGIRMGCTIWSE